MKIGPAWTRCACAIAAAATLGMPAHAQDIPGYPAIEDYDPREVAMLPKFCPYTLLFREKVPGGSNVAEADRWRSVLGDAMRHLHHYCWGLMKTNRAVLLARDEQTRLGYLTDSIREFDYVIQRASPDFILLPEILTKKGQNLIRLRKAPLGVMELERAAELKPDYWPPYAYMSDYYKDAGDKAKARETLERGLAASPEAPALRRRLAELESSSGAARPKRKTRAD